MEKNVRGVVLIHHENGINIQYTVEIYRLYCGTTRYSTSIVLYTQLIHHSSAIYAVYCMTDNNRLYIQMKIIKVAGFSRIVTEDWVRF